MRHKGKPFFSCLHTKFAHLHHGGTFMKGFPKETMWAEKGTTELTHAFFCPHGWAQQIGYGQNSIYFLKETLMKHLISKKKLYLIACLVAIAAMLVSACGTSTPAPMPTKIPVAKLETTLVCNTICAATVKNVGEIPAKFRLNEFIEEPGVPALDEPKFQPTNTLTPKEEANARLLLAYGTKTPTPFPTLAPDRKNYRLFINQRSESYTDIAPGETKEFVFSYSYKPSMPGKFAVKHLVFVKNANNDGETALEQIEALLTVSVPDIKMVNARSFTCDEKSIRITIDSDIASPPWNSVYRDNLKFLEFENKIPSSITIIWPTPVGAKMLEMSGGTNFEHHKNRMYCMPPTTRDDK